MNIWIIDDDVVFLDSLEEYVEQIGREFSVEMNIKTEKSTETLDYGACMKADVILLDIDMPGESGIDFAKRLKEKAGYSERPYLIFVTGHDSMVFDALKTMPYSFVRKSELGLLTSCLRHIAELLKNENCYIIHYGRETVTLKVNEIVYLEKDKNYVVFHTLEGVYRERAQMDDKHHDLAMFGFIRIHIGGLVNPNYISRFRQDTVVLSNGRELSVSRKYRTTAKNSFYDWMMKPI